MKEILQLSATQIGHKISLGEVCPVDLIEAYIEKINSYPKSNTIFTTIMIQKALKQAYEAKDRVKTNNRISILDGVPISWKDICDIEGYPSEAGSALLRGRVPNHNAEVIKNATQSGLISLSKTHMTELAFSGLGINPITKTPNNAIDSKLAPGGSSSGAAVGVALNLVAGSIGSDTGGSVRVPAAWNNLVGLKTTHGLVSLNGVLPLCPKFDTIGPIVKSVEDAANLLAAIIPNKRIKIQNDNSEIKHLAVIETVFLDNLDKKVDIVFEKGLELPHHLQVSCEYTYIGKYLPNAIGKHFELNWLKENQLIQKFGTYGTDFTESDFENNGEAVSSGVQRNDKYRWITPENRQDRKGIFGDNVSRFKSFVGLDD